MVLQSKQTFSEEFGNTAKMRPIQEPKYWTEIHQMGRFEKENSIQATREEIKTLTENDTWKLVHVLLRKETFVIEMDFQSALRMVYQI